MTEEDSKRGMEKGREREIKRHCVREIGGMRVGRRERER